MKIIKSIIIIVFIILYSYTFLFSDVKIIRKTPQVEGNVVNAQWRKAPPPQIEEQPRTIITGKAELGATGGSSVDGSSIMNVYTDSSVSLVRPFDFADLNISAGAYRKSYLQGSDDSYSLEMELSADLWSLGLNAKYGFSNNQEKDEYLNNIKKNANNLLLEANASALFIQSMPVSMAYSHEEKNTDENNLETENTVENNVNLNTNGSFGDLTVDFTGSLDNKEDAAKSMLSRQYGANINVGYAVSDIFNLKSHVNPTHSLTSYNDTDTNINSTILDYGIGFYMLFSDNLQITTDLGRVDTWTDSNAGANPIWKALASVMYKPTDNISLNSTYNFNKIISGNLQNQLNLDFLYGNDDALVQNIGAGGGIDYVSDNNGEEASKAINWKGNIELAPAENITIDTNYSGGFSEKYDLSLSKMASLWNHDFGINFEHEVLETLKYDIGAKLSGYLPQYLANQVKQEYSTAITFAPPIDWRTLILNTSENFSITNTDSNSDLSSALNFSASITATKTISTHYNFGWNWIDLSTASASNNFSHTLGFVINGKKKPLSFGVDYTLQHGTIGIRHNLESNFYYPFSESLGMRAWSNLSSYKEDDSWKTPFVLGASSIYMF